MASRSEKLNVDLTATDKMSKVVDAAAGNLDKIPKSTDTEIDADDNASKVAADVEGNLDKIPKSTDTEIDASMGPGLTGAIAALDGLPGNISGLGRVAAGVMSPGGAVLGMIAGLGAAATSTANAALNVQTMASFTGEDFSYVDKFSRVFEGLGGLSANDLIEMVSEVARTIADKPELARLLGVDPQFVADHPLKGLVALVDGINASQLDTAERMQTIMTIFGEEGGKQISKILGLGVDLSDLIEGMPSVVSEEDAQNALELKLAFAEMVAHVGKLAATFGGPLLDSFNEWANRLDGLMGEDVVNLPEFPDSWRAFVSGMESLDMQRLVLDFVDLGGNLERVRDGHMRLADAQAAVELGLPTEGFTLTAEAAAFLAEQEEAAAAAADGLSKGAGFVEKAMADATEATDGLSKGAGFVEKAMADATSAADGLSKGTGEIPKRMADAADATDELTEATKEQVEALEAEKDALEASVEALEAKIDAQRSAFDTGIAYRESIEDLADANVDYQATLADTEAGENDVRDAGQLVIEELLGQADAYVANQRAQAEARGETFSFTQAVNAQNTAIAAQAGTIDASLIPQLVDMALQINNIPEEHRSVVTAAIASGDPERITNTLNLVSGTRTTAVELDLNEAQVANIEAIITALTRARTVKVTGSSKFGKFHSGGIVPGPRSQESLAVLQGGEAVFTADQQRALAGMIGSAGGRGDTAGATFHVTVNMPPGSDGEDVLRALQNLQRRRGPLPLRVA